jgi:hypothetical protein
VTATLLLATGEALEVEGTLEDVAKQLENSSRSSAGTLAWFKEVGSGEQIGLNAAHVVTIRSGAA